MRKAIAKTENPSFTRLGDKAHRVAKKTEDHEGVAVGYSTSGMDTLHFSSRLVGASHGKKIVRSDSGNPERRPAGS
jgi:hypothetical protein